MGTFSNDFMGKFSHINGNGNGNGNGGNGNGNGGEKKTSLTYDQAAAKASEEQKKLEGQGYVFKKPIASTGTETKGAFTNVGTKKGETTTKTIPSQQKTTYVGTKKYTGKKSWVDILGESGNFSDQTFEQMLKGADGEPHFSDTPENREKWKQYYKPKTETVVGPDETEDFKVEYEESTGGSDDTIVTTPEEQNDGSSAAITEDPEKKKKKKKGLKGLLSGISKSKKGKDRNKNVDTTPEMQGSSKSGDIAGKLNLVDVTHVV